MLCIHGTLKAAILMSGLLTVNYELYTVKAEGGTVGRGPSLKFKEQTLG